MTRSRLILAALSLLSVICLLVFCLLLSLQSVGCWPGDLSGRAWGMGPASEPGGVSRRRRATVDPPRGGPGAPTGALSL